MSQLVLAPLIILLIPGLILLISGKSNHHTPSQRRQLCWGGLFLGAAFLYFGVVTTIGMKISARPQVTGVIHDLRQNNGRRNQSSTFKVSTADGQTSDLSCGCTDNALREGETVFVRYLEFDHSIVYLKILDGPNVGWSFNVSNDTWLGLIPIALAALGFYIAYTYRPKIDFIDGSLR